MEACFPSALRVLRFALDDGTGAREVGTVTEFRVSVFADTRARRCRAPPMGWSGRGPNFSPVALVEDDMRNLVSLPLLAFFLGGPACAAATTAPPTLRPAELLEQARSWVGKLVTVDIVEPLQGPSTPELLAKVEYGTVRVSIPESPGRDLALVPAEFRLADADRYKRRFDRVLTSPLRVQGEFLADPGSGTAFVLRVLSLEPLPEAPPIRVASVAEILADPARFDRKLIEIEGMHHSGFEISALESKIWLSRAPNAGVVRKAAANGDEKPAGQPSGWGTRRVRVVGTLFSRPGAHYGHLGGYPLLLVAREIEEQ
jgi:hypothetical protein